MWVYIFCCDQMFRVSSVKNFESFKCLFAALPFKLQNRRIPFFQKWKTIVIGIPVFLCPQMSMPYAICVWENYELITHYVSF